MTKLTKPASHRGTPMLIVMLILLPIAIVLAFTLPFPMNMIQAIVASFSLGTKVVMWVMPD